MKRLLLLIAVPLLLAGCVVATPYDDGYYPNYPYYGYYGSYYGPYPYVLGPNFVFIGHGFHGRDGFHGRGGFRGSGGFHGRGGFHGGSSRGNGR